jgi:hypothetical protein
MRFGNKRQIKIKVGSLTIRETKKNTIAKMTYVRHFGYRTAQIILYPA